MLDGSDLVIAFLSFMAGAIWGALWHIEKCEQDKDFWWQHQPREKDDE